MQEKLVDCVGAFQIDAFVMLRNEASQGLQIEMLRSSA